MRGVSLLVLALLVAGCSSDGATPPETIGQSGGGSPATHLSEADYEAGAVLISYENGRYVAQRTDAYRNDFGGAVRAAITLDAPGEIVVQPGPTGGYTATVSLRAEAGDEASARQALAAAEVEPTDDLDGDLLTLAILVDGQSGVGASIRLTVPGGPAYSITARSLQGPVSLTGLHGGDFVVAAGTSATLDRMVGASLDLQAGTGATVDGTFDNVLIAAAGSVKAQLQASETGQYKVSPSSALDLQLGRGTGSGYDVVARSLFGTVEIQMTGDAVGAQAPNQAHVQTSGFAQKTVRTLVDLNSTGTIVVRDA